jgi:hypothetical protein
MCFPQRSRQEITHSKTGTRLMSGETLTAISRKMGCFSPRIFSETSFFLLGGKIYSFDAETAERTLIADELEGWAAAILSDYERLTSFPLAHEWQLQNGPLRLGYRLAPKKPFVIGGGYNLDNLRAVLAVRGMRWRGEISRQLIDLPDGQPVTVKLLP